MMYKSSKNNSWVRFAFLYGIPKLKKLAMEVVNGFFLLLKNVMNSNCCGSNSSLCVVLLQHYRMLKNHMLIHGHGLCYT
jgi:hypothetical protein